MSDQKTPKRDVYAAYRFYVELKGVTEGSFSECSGLQAETEVFEWESGGMNIHKYRLPGRTKYPNLVLKRGVATTDLWSWYYKVVTGEKIERHNCGIVLIGYTGMAEARWDIVDALPVKWSGPAFKSGSGEAAVETIELIHHGFKRTK
ncbi:MAG TPA: phage tail protein [Roseiflexaceae bacterium]|nr:phage tail protein [Roseiflexaceae bacterium]